MLAQDVVVALNRSLGILNSVNGYLRPTFDASRRELRVGDAVIRRFKRSARNQIVVLETFELEQWPLRIDDPLPVAKGTDPQQRLRDTIYALNRHQDPHMLRFLSGGTGDTVSWQFRQTSQIADVILAVE